MKTVDYVSKDRLERFLKRIEELKGKRKLYIEGKKDVKFNNPADVIVALYEGYRSDRTKFAHNDSLQKSGHSRSIGDLYRICSFYIPDVKIKDVIDSARSVQLDDLEGGICYLSVVYCTDINKITYHHDGEQIMDELPSKYDFSDDEVFLEKHTYQLLSDLDL